MAIYNFVGFEPGTTQQIGQAWHLSGSYAYGVVSGQKYGDGAWRGTGTSAWHQAYTNIYACDNSVNDSRAALFSSSDASVYMSFWFKTDKEVTSGLGKVDLRIAAGNTGPWYLQVTMDDMYLAIKPYGSSLQTGSISVSVGDWHHIKVRWDKASGWLATDGRVRVWLDGVLDIDYTGWTHHTSPTQYVIGKTTGSSGDDLDDFDIFFDDVIISNSQFYDDYKISSCAVPKADGNYTSWLGVYTRLQERSDIAYNDPAQYPSDREVNSINRITNSTINRIESQVIDISDATYGILTDGPSSGDTIAAVRIDWYSYMSDADPAYTTVKFYPRIGGTDYSAAVTTGAALANDITYPNYTWMSETNPATGNPWQYSDLTGTNFEAVANNVATSGTAARVSSVQFSVLWTPAVATSARRIFPAHAGL